MRTLPLAALAAALALAHPAAAQSLNRVNVSAPAINCVFSTSCTVSVSDLSTPYLGNGFVQSRTFQGQPGSPAAGKWVYEYRIDVTSVVRRTTPQVTSLSLPVAAPIVAMDFNGDGNAGDQVFIVTGGGLGAVGPGTAWLHGDTLHFTFNPPISGPTPSAGGQSSFFFGFVTDSPPMDAQGRIEANVLPDHFLTVRVPQWMASATAAPGRPRVPTTPSAPRPVRPPSP